MLESRSEDALVLLVKLVKSTVMTVETVETVEAVETVETVETVVTVESVETVETAETAETEETEETKLTENRKKKQLLTHLLTDNLKARDASASKKRSEATTATLRCLPTPSPFSAWSSSSSLPTLSLPHPLLKTTLTGVGRTVLGFWVFRPKLTKTKRFPPILDHMNGKIFLGSSRFPSGKIDPKLAVAGSKPHNNLLECDCFGPKNLHWMFSWCQNVHIYSDFSDL